MSKDSGVLKSTRSEAAEGTRSETASRKQVRLALVTSTPLGSPVEPEV